jgi:hypothetical protein
MSSFRPALVGAFVLLGAVSVHAQGTVDDLSCFLVRDQVPRGSVRAILNGLGGQSCRIKVPAAFACISSQGTTVTPAPPAASQPGVSTNVLCYWARCAPPRPRRRVVADAFGSRPVKFRAARWICLPAAMEVPGAPTTTTVPGSPVTTTTTSGAATTTTTIPGQPGGCHYANGMCTGNCGPGMSCGSTVGSLSCECRSVSCGQADAPACNGACADPSKTCVFIPLSGCSCV